ncbi:MAG: hypothetical protein BGO38_15715 [Cellulomonas sp. 73-145]|uniref:GH116 family glycosyl-hydrolase n=1 Tax=Cellulomonas sp. 73-145 TaxID=1895739 RepID=UPI00092C1D8D|nr:GH116 family glycosyl-hydrolase [Cellulomonas sp. 73-145]OJV58805.1 MAG: hypothetical protein BGO38_15715 [Cellulomonas sp. 73-145]
MTEASVLDSGAAPAAALPLGGIGTGNLAIGADGALRQWQLHNLGNHLGELPNTFFALRYSGLQPPVDGLRVLQARSFATEPVPMVNDAAVPAWHEDLFRAFPPVAATRLRGFYPFADLEVVDADLPVGVTVEAFSPLVPHDADTSSVPAAMFTVQLTNRSDDHLHGWFAGALQNDVGADGVVNPRGTHHPGYGGNTNRLERAGRWTTLVCENGSIPDDDPRAGQLALALEGHGSVAQLCWSTPADLAERLRSLVVPGLPEDGSPSAFVGGGDEIGGNGWRGPSPAGQTWAGAVAVPWHLAPGESTAIRAVLAWSFPHRFVNYPDFGPRHPERGLSRFWLGNWYARRYPRATDVVADVTARWEELRGASDAWRRTLRDSSLPTDVAERLAAQAVPLRTPTVFRAGTGEVFGFEGVNGASTLHHAGAVGGSCPLNCTHVWNYEHAMAALFPSLELSMRDTELDVMQAPDGYVPHRVIAPTYLPQLWDVPIGGPDEPALDGMLGTVLKTYREVRAGAGEAWLTRRWPRIGALLDHVARRWDPAGTGVLSGIQPSTHDIDLRGTNPFMGTLWLAALRAAEELALLQGDDARARWCRDRFEAGSAEYDRRLWNGDYYVQVLAPDEPDRFQWGPGCLSDQLIGQWWAHTLDLGYLLPREHVVQALRAVVRHNHRASFRDAVHTDRVYADRDDSGLVMCSWPSGGRPTVPTRYADEVWSGSEYEVAAHCLYEGLVDEGMAILRGLWARHDGSRRNPWNEVECGDHYARSMAGWTVLTAITGQQHDAGRGTLSFAPVAGLVTPDGGTGVVRLPFVTGQAWGTVELGERGAALRVEHGSLTLTELGLPGQFGAVPRVALDGADLGGVAGRAEESGTGSRLGWERPGIVIGAGQRLTVDRS